MKSLRLYIAGVAFVARKMLAYFPSHAVRKFIFTKVFGCHIGKHVALYSGFEIRSPKNLSIGSGTSIGHGAVLDARYGLTIGENVNFSSEVMIWTAQHDYRDKYFNTTGASVIIENYAWLGPRSIILPGVTIGEGAVVAAGAVVTKNIKPYTLVGGIPAKRIGDRPRDLDYSPGKEVMPFA